MTRWEYYVPAAYEFEASHIQDALDNLGEKGWELVCWIDRPIFKRPIEEKNDG